MLLTLKKVIGGMMLPLPLVLITMGIDLALFWFNYFQKIGKMCVSPNWLVLLLLSLQPVADSLLKPIEDNYPTWQDTQKVEYIVMLGGGYTQSPQRVLSSNLISNSLPCLGKGIRLWRASPGSKLISTGAAAENNNVSATEAGARIAQSLGAPPGSIIILNKLKDIEKEIIAVKQAIGSAPFLLMTSASHSPRAMVFSQQAGLHPLSVPANQLAIDSPLNPWGRAIPPPVWLVHSDRVGYGTTG